MNSWWKRLWREDDGQDMVEYSLLLAFIALAVIAVLSNVAGSIRAIFTTGIVNATAGAT